MEGTGCLSRRETRRAYAANRRKGLTKHRPASQVIVTLSVGSKKMTIEGGSEGLNPVWNKGVTIDVDPDVLTGKSGVLLMLGVNGVRVDACH